MESAVHLSDEELIAQFKKKIIITPSHVIKAKQVLWRKRRKYNVFDGFLALGSALFGASLPHLFQLAEASAEPNLWLTYSGVLGGFLLGMGVIGKAKED